MVILSLIVKRTRVKAVVKDRRAAIEAFGTYVELIGGVASDGPLPKKALRGTRAIICPNEGFLFDSTSLKGIQHIVLLSQVAALCLQRCKWRSSSNEKQCETIC